MRESPRRPSLIPRQKLIAGLLLGALDFVARGALIACDSGMHGSVAAAVTQPAAEAALTRWREGSCG